jgi:hypothetical protein
MKKILYVTDLHYQANGRKYYEEDLYLTASLRNHFHVVLCNPLDLASFEDNADLIVLRNTGPSLNWKKEYLSFRQRVVSKTLNTFNSFNGKGDMNGKSYLLELTRLGFPVIPTVDDYQNVSDLPISDHYLLKPIDGADSVGIKVVSAADLMLMNKLSDDTLIQPLLKIIYEVSFYFIDGEFQYALFEPDVLIRWELVTYQATNNDLCFASQFVKWNNLNCGIERVDACRISDGRLLLVEHEDLNPYLSLSVLTSSVREKFVKRFIKALENTL